MRRLFHAAVWLLPSSRFKNALLRAIGYGVHSSARIQSNVVWGLSSAEISEGCSIRRWNQIKELNLLIMGPGSWIGKHNRISAIPAFGIHGEGGALILADHAIVTSGHDLDCSGSIKIGAFSMVAGRGSSLMSHAINLATNVQEAHAIVIGDRSFVGNRVVIMGGALLPSKSVLGAGAVLLRRKSGERRPSGIYAGVPAEYVRPSEGKWFDRSEPHTRTARVSTRSGEAVYANLSGTALEETVPEGK